MAEIRVRGVGNHSKISHQPWVSEMLYRNTVSIVFVYTASARFVVCESCHHFYQVITDVDSNSSSSEAERVVSNLPSPKQV